MLVKMTCSIPTRVLSKLEHACCFLHLFRLHQQSVVATMDMGHFVALKLVSPTRVPNQFVGLNLIFQFWRRHVCFFFFTPNPSFGRPEPKSQKMEVQQPGEVEPRTGPRVWITAQDTYTFKHHTKGKLTRRFTTESGNIGAPFPFLCGGLAVFSRIHRIWLGFRASLRNPQRSLRLQQVSESRKQKRAVGLVEGMSGISKGTP